MTPVSRRSDQEPLPPGRFPRDSPRALATWPLVTLTIGVFALAISLVVLAVLAIAGGSSPEQVRHAFSVIADDSASPGGWTAALLSSGGLVAVIRRISQLGGLERQAGVTNARLDNIGAMLVELTSQVREDREMVRSIDDHRARQVATLRAELRQVLEGVAVRDEEENDPSTTDLEVDDEPPPARPVARRALTPLDTDWSEPVPEPSPDAQRRAREQWERILHGHTIEAPDPKETR